MQAPVDRDVRPSPMRSLAREGAVQRRREPDRDLARSALRECCGTCACSEGAQRNRRRAGCDRPERCHDLLLGEESDAPFPPPRKRPSHECRRRRIADDSAREHRPLQAVAQRIQACGCGGGRPVARKHAHQFGSRETTGRHPETEPLRSGQQGTGREGNGTSGHVWRLGTFRPGGRWRVETVERCEVGRTRRAGRGGDGAEAQREGDAHPSSARGPLTYLSGARMVRPRARGAGGAGRGGSRETGAGADAGGASCTPALTTRSRTLPARERYLSGPGPPGRGRRGPKGRVGRGRRAGARGARSAQPAPAPAHHHSTMAQRFFFATEYRPRSGETAVGVPTRSSQAASAMESP